MMFKRKIKLTESDLRKLLYQQHVTTLNDVHRALISKDAKETKSRRLTAITDINTMIMRELI